MSAFDHLQHASHLQEHLTKTEAQNKTLSSQIRIVRWIAGALFAALMGVSFWNGSLAAGKQLAEQAFTSVQQDLLCAEAKLSAALEHMQNQDTLTGRIAADFRDAVNTSTALTDELRRAERDRGQPPHRRLHVRCHDVPGVATICEDGQLLYQLADQSWATPIVDKDGAVKWSPRALCYGTAGQRELCDGHNSLSMPNDAGGMLTWTGGGTAGINCPTCTIISGTTGTSITSTSSGQACPNRYLVVPKDKAPSMEHVPMDVDISGSLSDGYVNTDGR